jgi:hypothetical protein
MIERWYKAPVGCLFDVRIARMPAGLFRSWHQMLALASLNNGALPPVEQIAFSLRSTAATVLKRLQALAERGLAALSGEAWGLVDPQAKDADDADAPLSGAERTRRWRERKAGGAIVVGDAESDDVTQGDALIIEERKIEKTKRGERHSGEVFAAVKRATFGQAAGVWIAQGDPEWEPWAARWRAEKGRSPPTGKRGGWRFPSLSPQAIAAE